MQINSNKQKLGIAFLGISLLLLVLDTPFKSMGYFVGSLLPVLVSWTLILGAIAYVIWRFGFKKREKLFLFIFSILFLLAALFQFAVSIFEGYVAQKISDIPLEKFTTNSSLSNSSRLEIKDLSVSIEFPSEYPNPEYEDKSRERSGRLIRAGSYKTSNLDNGAVTFDGPGLKQFLFNFAECPADLGCTLEKEVSDLVLAQELKGGKVFRNETIIEGDAKIVDIVFERELNGIKYFFRHFLIPHNGYILNPSVQVQNSNDLDLPVVQKFFGSIQI
ncbi:MAG TPA: hypothetical protein VJG67_00010 [Candidatus Paceibacterota bacterium]